MVYRDFKDIKKTAANKFLRDKAFNIAKDTKYDGNQRGLASMVINFLIEKLAVVLNPCLKMSNYLKNFINPLSENSKKKSLFSIQRQYLGC